MERRSSSALSAVKRALERVYLDDVARAVLRAAGNAKDDYRRGFGRLDRRLTVAYLDRHDVRKLHLGCGARVLDGWLNTDADPRAPGSIRVDVTAELPFPDETFDYVFSEHMIEHVPYPAGHRMLRECHRVMKPGAAIRISTPDLAFLVGLYRGRDRSEHLEAYLAFYHEQATPWAPRCEDAFFINNFVRDWGHEFIYDETTLRLSLEEAGFGRITRHELNESEHEALRGLENEQRMPEGYLALETFTLEAIR